MIPTHLMDPMLKHILEPSLQQQQITHDLLT